LQAEDGIRDCHVTGVQTCALPIYRSVNRAFGPGPANSPGLPCANEISWTLPSRLTTTSMRCDSALTAEAPTPCRPPEVLYPDPRSEERRVGKGASGHRRSDH